MKKNEMPPQPPIKEDPKRDPRPVEASLPPLEEMARDYVELVSSPPTNAMGQHVHPRWGISHDMLRKMSMVYGEPKVREAVQDEMLRRQAFTASQRSLAALLQGD